MISADLRTCLCHITNHVTSNTPISMIYFCSRLFREWTMVATSWMISCCFRGVARLSSKKLRKGLKMPKRLVEALAE